jgi:hypothetical protein
MNYNIHSEATRAVAIDALTRLPLDEKHRYLCVVKRRLDGRSVSQNRLYWLWLACIADETGNDKDALHEFFKQKYLSGRETTLRVINETVVTRLSTTDLDLKEMTLYLDCISQFALAELGISLPQPRDFGWEEFYERYKNFII